MQKTLIIIGMLILLAGIFWPWLEKLPLGRLPGDIYIKGENSRFFFPLTTMIIVSILLSVLISLFKK